MTPLDGELGRYRLARLIGKGGMGEVYLARDPTLERDVAIKVLPADHAADRSARRRLLHEAQAAAQLDHPCICPVFEIGESPDGRTFIAMPYLHGETLAARLERGPLPVREALGLAQHVAEALCVAHAHGIVHRDLKPQNVMLTPSGLPKLLDFGVAKLRQSGSAAAEVSTASGDTATGAVVGTPAYMAPEQVAGQEVDERCDLFALGAVVFECLTGRRAFEGRTLFEVAAAVSQSTPPAVSALRREVPPGVDDLCARLLQKDAIDRFQTATEVVGALRLLSTSSDARFAPHPPRRTSWYRARLAWLAAAVAVAGALAIGYWAWAESRRLPEPSPQAVRWYLRGTDFIREGAYHSANQAFEQALRLFPEFPLAYARQAEALAELDDQTTAGERLLRMQAVLGDEARLDQNDRVRLRGIRSTVLRDLPQAVESYRELTERTPADAGVWVDFGRAQEAAEQREDARRSYLRAVDLDAGLAPAHMRLAVLDAAAGRREPAMESFSKAEALYRASSNTEGEAETLLRRGMFLSARGERNQAQQDLDRARVLAESSGARAQSVRARLALGSLAASSGRYEEGEALIGNALEEARRLELWSTVADGLIDWSGLLVNQSSRLAEADDRAAEGVRLAQQRGAARAAARGTLQLASTKQQLGQSEEALQLSKSALPFLQAKGYRRLELAALDIASRAQRRLGHLEEAEKTARDVLAAARDLGDEAQVGGALTTLAGIAVARGALPQALALRQEAAAVNLKLGYDEVLPFDLTNQAELLILLGRTVEAAPLLAQVEAGIRNGVAAFKGRQDRLTYLRALVAATTGRFVEAGRHAAMVSSTAGSTTLAAAALRHYAAARLGVASRREPLPAPTRDVVELWYWHALEAWWRQDAEGAWARARDGLAMAQKMSNDELAWRLAAVGSQAARGSGRAADAAAMASAAKSARERLRRAWEGAFTPYLARPDIRQLDTWLGANEGETR